MNSEDFVTYEQALALKKLGFDYKCNHLYENDGTFKEDDCYGSCNTSKIEYYRKEDYADAPTLAQVDKWLRSKGLWVEICLEPFDEKGWQFDIFNLKDHRYYNFAFSTVYDTYEKALSAGITECIKILEKGCQN